MSAICLLASNSFITYNKTVAKLYGVNTAVLLGALCSYQSYSEEKEFTKTKEEMIDDTCLSKYEILTSMETLVKVGILQIEKKGMPAQNYYKIDENQLLLQLSKNWTTSRLKIRQQVVQKLDDNLLTNNNIIIEEENKNKKEKENILKEKSFHKPTIDEVKTYCLERNNNVDAIKFWNYYESKGWKVGKAPMKDWQASVRTWERGLATTSSQSTTPKKTPKKLEYGETL